MLFCLVVFFPNLTVRFVNRYTPTTNIIIFCVTITYKVIQVWKDTRFSKLHCCHFGVNNLFYTHFSSLYTLFCPRMVLKHQICVIQAENEAVHFSQQHDKLRHSVGLKDQP